jgi:hypothetical protein
MTVEGNLDGSRTEYFAVECTEARLLTLLREVFEEHWAHVIFGPCIEGAVFEGRFGPHWGSPELPTPPALAEWRRCARAAFFQSRDRAGRPSAWGLRLRNGRDEQMLTVFLPNPWIDPARGRYVDTPDWSRLELWMDLRARHAGVPAEGPPAHAEPPRTH